MIPHYFLQFIAIILPWAITDAKVFETESDELTGPILQILDLSVFASSDDRSVNVFRKLANDRCSGTWYSPLLASAKDCPEVVIVDDIRVKVTGKRNTFDHVSSEPPPTADEAEKSSKKKDRDTTINATTIGSMRTSFETMITQDHVRVTIESQHGDVSLNRDYRYMVHDMGGSRLVLSQFLQFTTVDTELQASLSSLHYQYKWSKFDTSSKAYNDTITITMDYGNCHVLEEDRMILFMPRDDRTCRTDSFPIRIVIHHPDGDPTDRAEGLYDAPWELVPYMFTIAAIVKLYGLFKERCAGKYEYESDDEDDDDDVDVDVDSRTVDVGEGTEINSYAASSDSEERGVVRNRKPS